MCGVLLALFLVVPVAEIYLILQVGSWLGTTATVAIIVATALVGAPLAKSQGIAVLTQLRESMVTGQDPQLALVEGVLVLAAGVTLLAPGFVTDAAGIALLIPLIRRYLAARIAKRLGGNSVVYFGVDDSDDSPPPGVIDV